MASIALTHETAGKLRALNILRDLPAVADLIELCFSNTLDEDGRSFLDDMRRSAQENRFLNWAPRVIDSISLPLSGFVWEEQGKIVGNVSLIPFFKWGRKVYLIANVATHPEYRRRGIARLLTQAAVARAREKHADEIWLHVREDNPGAITLYQELGFQEQARRTQWNASSGTTATRFHFPDIQINPRSSRDWEAQSNWYQQTYPASLGWYFQQSFEGFQPGLLGGIYRMFSDDEISQWSAYHHGKLMGVAALQTSFSRSAHIWLAFPANPDPDALTELLLYIRQMDVRSRNLLLDYPSSQGPEAIRAAGFRPYRTLLWMRVSGATF